MVKNRVKYPTPGWRTIGFKTPKSIVNMSIPESLAYDDTFARVIKRGANLSQMEILVAADRAEELGFNNEANRLRDYARWDYKSLYVNKSPEDSQASIDNPKPAAFATNHVRIISHMQIPVNLQSDPQFSQLQKEGRLGDAANRAEDLGYYAVAHAMRQNENDAPTGDVGLMGNSKFLSKNFKLPKVRKGILHSR